MAVVRIDLSACINCGWCRRVCPTGAIKYFSTGRRTHVVERDRCIDCGICPPVCPVQCIHPEPEYVVPAEALERSKETARAFAAEQRRMRLDREAAVARAIARLGAQSHA